MEWYQAVANEMMLNQPIVTNDCAREPVPMTTNDVVALAVILFFFFLILRLGFKGLK